MVPNIVLLKSNTKGNTQPFNDQLYKKLPSEQSLSEGIGFSQNEGFVKKMQLPADNVKTEIRAFLILPCLHAVR